MADRDKTPKTLNVRQRRVARTLRAWVEDGDIKWTQGDLAKQLRWSVGKLNNLLTGKTAAGPDHILSIAIMCRIPEDEWRRVWGFAEAGAHGDVWWRTFSPGTVPDYLHDYLDTEAEATAVRTLEGMLIPGLLQDVPYTRAVVEAWLAEPDETIVQERLDLRRRRQARLDDHENPLSLYALVTEAALRQQVGYPDRSVMINQLDHLIERAALPNVTLKVLPVELGAYPGFGASYHLLEFDSGEAEALYLENLESGLYVEDEKDIGVYTLNFERLSRMALDPQASTERIMRIREEYARGEKENRL